MSELVKVERVSQSFGGMQALNSVSLTIEAGSYTVLLGPSGSGKTTLLSILGGFLQPTSGRVLIRGLDCTTMAPARRPTATVFQDYALFPHMSIGANVAFGLRMKGLSRSEQIAKSRQMLEMVGLAEAFEKRPHQLSGGQRQRVALARALIMEPAVLLLDEPLSALDLKLRRQMQDELKALQKRVGTAFVHVTHDQEEAMALADHIVVMNRGRIEDQGPPERVYGKPATRFTATFMGESTIVDGSIDESGRITTVLGNFLGSGSARNGRIHVAIRPEHIRLGPGIEATVKDVVYQGSFKRVTVIPATAPDINLVTRLPADADIRPDTPISLCVDQNHVILLND